MRGAIYVTTSLLIATSVHTAAESLQIKSRNVRKHDILPIGGMDTKTLPKMSLKESNDRVVHTTADEERNSLARLIAKTRGEALKLMLPETLANEKDKAIVKVSADDLSKMIMKNLGSPAAFKEKKEIQDLEEEDGQLIEDLAYLDTVYTARRQIADATRQFSLNKSNEAKKLIKKLEHHSSRHMTAPDKTLLEHSLVATQHYNIKANKAALIAKKAAQVATENEFLAGESFSTLTEYRGRSQEIKRTIQQLKESIDTEASIAMRESKRLRSDVSSEPSSPSNDESDPVQHVHNTIKTAVTNAPSGSALNLLKGLTSLQARQLFHIANKGKIAAPGSHVANNAIRELSDDANDIPWYALWYMIFHDFCVKNKLLLSEGTDSHHPPSS